ncbi:MAG: 23S rRNA (adenine(2503)-C(2))-methyltransferase RlmN [Defluviitaleaceae bacterium]|nr:23S rRNA (adenine(2503)-C(2))-methyltransferase RlmN [Defluviitaleaceae bacterium]
MKTDIRSMTMDELTIYINSIGEKPFRAKQIFEWINQKLAASFSEMTNLPKDLREFLDENAIISKIDIVKRLVSSKDGTRKYLFELEKDTIIESVLMKYDHGNVACISSQAGCRMGCFLCASTLNGLERNLTAGELAAQVYEIQKDIGERISGVVIMGGGEPFDNYDNTIKFLKLITSEQGLEIGQRHITVSTCGLVDKIMDFAHEGFKVNLAISLHAPNDDIRKEIMPVAKRFKIDETIEAGKYFTEKTGRRITYEYALINGINDNGDHARELGRKLRNSLSHVNLITMNSVPGRSFKGSSRESAGAFAKVLMDCGVEATVRRKLGNDINAACGQLKNGHSGGV